MKGRVGGNIRGDKEQVFLGGAAQRGVWLDEGGDDDGSVPWFYRWSFFLFFFFLFKCFTAPQHQNKALGLQRGAMWGRREAEKQQLVQQGG